MLYDVQVSDSKSLSRSFDSYPEALFYVLDLFRFGCVSPCQVCINVSNSSNSFTKEK